MDQGFNGTLSNSFPEQFSPSSYSASNAAMNSQQSSQMLAQASKDTKSKDPRAFMNGTQIQNVNVSVLHFFISIFSEQFAYEHLA